MHQLKEVDMLSAKLDLLIKKLDDKGGDKKEVMHVYDSHMTCDKCGVKMAISTRNPKPDG